MTLHLHYSHRFFLYELRICVIRTGVVRATKASRHPYRCYFTLNLDSSAKLDEIDGCESCSMRMPDDHGMVSLSVREYGTCSSHDCMLVLAKARGLLALVFGFLCRFRTILLESLDAFPG